MEKLFCHLICTVLVASKVYLCWLSVANILINKTKLLRQLNKKTLSENERQNKQTQTCYFHFLGQKKMLNILQHSDFFSFLFFKAEIKKFLFPASLL